MSTQSYSCYSVDASVMIEFKNIFPEDLFQSIWNEVTRLTTQGRWKIFETVAGELQDTQLKRWLIDNPQSVVKFDGRFNTYLSKFMAECQQNGMMLINPSNTRNNGDPFVIALALYLEGRDIRNLKVRTGDTVCCVLTNELPRDHKVNIPYVCVHYNLPYLNMFDLMRHHQWQITINVQNP